MYYSRISNVFGLMNQTKAILPHLCRYAHRKTAKNNGLSDDSTFTTIYRLDKMQTCSIPNKLKKYQLALVGAGTPTVLTLSAYNLADETIVQAFTSFGFASTVALFSIGQIFTNLVGFVYVSKDQSNVKFSYLNFWGDRVDSIVPLEDVSITPKSSVPWDYLNVKDDSKPYKISLRHGEILSTPLFRKALKHDPDAGVGD